MTICDVQKCTGCFSCMNVCPNHAISIGYDSMLKTIPSVDDEKCIHCQLCQKSCPVLNKVVAVPVKQVYAATSKVKQDQERSSSGGIATVISRQIIRNNGVVYGASATNREVRHIRVDKLENLQLLQGSKYVQSSIGFIYQSVKQDLLSGKKVCFFGTPCQIAGLQCFLGTTYDNLLTVDLVCHGTPPFRYLAEHLQENDVIDWDVLVFRKGVYFSLMAFREDAKIYEKPSSLDRYYKAFLTSLTYRDNCYECEYSKEERISDLTLGDFWGLDKSTLKNTFDGRISLVLINSEKGETIFHDCHSEIVCERRQIEEGLNADQENLHHPSIPHRDRKKFEKKLQHKGFCYAVKHTGNEREIIMAIARERIVKTKLYQWLRHKNR